MFVGTLAGTPGAHRRRHGQRMRCSRSVAWWSAVLRFKTFGSARAAVRYYAKKGADCARDEEPVTRDGDAARAVDYYGEQGQSLGEWLGSGAAALGLAGSIRGGDAHVLERLLSGQ